MVQHNGENGDWEKVLEISERAISKKNDSEIYRLSKTNALLSLGKYDDCITLCDQLIAENDSLSDAYYNAGMAYFHKAVDMDKKIQLNTKQKNIIKENYQKSLTYLKCFRALVPEQKTRWALPLYTIYLNLNMGEEFDEIDKILRQQ